jgi:hypothetical protein
MVSTLLIHEKFGIFGMVELIENFKKMVLIKNLVMNYGKMAMTLLSTIMMRREQIVVELVS